jgi:RimJ/RimL family protein N-acetyltransferase
MSSRADGLTLRKVTERDAYALWVWANDLETRRASFGRPTIRWPDHIAWLCARLADPNAMYLIAELEGGQPAGSIRFDTSDNWQTARLSYVIAPEARGQGLSRALVSKGVAYLRDSHSRVAVRAEVVFDNKTSLHVFRSEGWEEQSVGEESHHFWLRAE